MEPAKISWFSSANHQVAAWRPLFNTLEAMFSDDGGHLR